jgi:hypothetical protein
MGYRRGYYKKDGSYVQGHFVKSNMPKNKNKKKKGCLGILLNLIKIKIWIKYQPN